MIATVAVAQPLELRDSLTPSLSAPEPHDFTVRADAARLTAICPSTAFRATSAAIAIRPLLGAERADYTPNQKFGKQEYFCMGTLTGFLAGDPTGKSGTGLRRVHRRRPKVN